MLARLAGGLSAFLHTGDVDLSLLGLGRAFAGGQDSESRTWSGARGWCTDVCVCACVRVLKREPHCVAQAIPKQWYLSSPSAGVTDTHHCAGGVLNLDLAVPGCGGQAWSSMRLRAPGLAWPAEGVQSQPGLGDSLSHSPLPPHTLLQYGKGSAPFTRVGMGFEAGSLCCSGCCGTLYVDQARLLSEVCPSLPWAGIKGVCL